MKLVSTFQPRIYQEVIAAQASKKNTLVVLPTGLGKTAISLLVIIQKFKLEPQKKILILAPTRPLVNQHMETFDNLLEKNDLEFVTFTGHTKPEKRAEQFKTANVIFSTPQGLENDVLTKRIDLNEISLIVFDEAHRATGEYSYVWLAKQFEKTNGLILGLTASPGADKDTVKEVVDNLHIEHIEVRKQDSPDVKPYIKTTTIRYKEVDLPEEFSEIQKLLQKAFANRIQEIKKYGAFQKKQAAYISKRDLLMFTASCQKEIAMGNPGGEVFTSLSLAAQAIKIQHAIELVETQGIPGLTSYISQLYSEASSKKSKAAISLGNDPLIRLAYNKTRELHDQGITHPKLPVLLQTVSQTLERKDAKVIVFSQYRDTLQMMETLLSKMPSVNAKLFLGQAKKKGTGMTQKEQLATLQQFKDGELNVLCMSSVGEEGLDIPAVDAVIFYEPIPSAIRTIQRKGRTGRQEEGKVIVLVAKNTRDVGTKWIALRKERTMYDVIDAVKKELKPLPKITLDSFVQLEFHYIYADSREQQSSIIRSLHDKGVEVKIKKLDVGDFVVSDDVVIELKRVDDFVNSLIDGRLFEQLKTLKMCVLKPLIVIQGEQSIYGVRNVHPNSINGMLATIAISYQIPIMFTRTDEETANLLLLLQKREGKKEFNPHASNKPVNKEDQLLYAVSAIPTIGQSTARKLLEHFGTIEKIVCASLEDLENVDGVGKQTAKIIYEFVRNSFSSASK